MKRAAPAGMSGMHLTLWQNALSDDDYSSYLPDTMRHLVPTIPRNQFLRSDLQQEDVTKLRYTIPAGGLQAWHTVSDCITQDNPGYASTYLPFITAYSEGIPLLEADKEPRWDIRWASHNEALAQVSATWKLLLYLFYGVPPKVDGPALARARTVANAMALADYLQVSEDVIRPALRAFAQSIPGLWKEISANPLFFLMLGYRLHSVDIYVDAVKHIVGPKVMLPYKARIARSKIHVRPHDLNELRSETIPEDVADFILEARYNMQDAAMEVQDYLLHRAESSHTTGEPSQLLHSRDAVLARFILVNFITTGYTRRELRWPDYNTTRKHTYREFREDENTKNLAAVWRTLWECKQKRNMLPMFEEKDLYSDAALLGIHWKVLHDAMLAVARLDLGPILDDYIVTSQATKDCGFCSAHKVTAPRNIIYEVDINSYCLNGKHGLCQIHQHHAKYHDVPYSTILHTWGDADHLNQGKT